MKATDKNNCCPYCRTKICENRNVKEEEEEEDEEDEEDEGEYEYGRETIEDGLSCYHFPSTIENITALAGVISEITGGTLNYERGRGWIGIILSLLKDQDNTIEFDFSLDDRYENLMQDSEETKNMLIKNPIEIYKQSVFLKKHFLEKIKHVKERIDV
jgi:hypothetical protein